MKWFLYLSILIILQSCQENAYYVHKLDIPNPWTYDKSLDYEFEVSDTTQVYQILLRVNHQKNFVYQNVYVKITTDFPTIEDAQTVVSLNIADGKGVFEGECGSSSCEVELLLKSGFKFKEIGKHAIRINQYGREEALNGLNSAELIIREKKGA